MSNRFIYLQEDVTGASPDNLIQGEVQVVPPGKVRLIVPKWGAFYKDSLKVFDSETLDPVDASLIKMGDSFPIGNERSGYDVYSCYTLAEEAPASVSFTYQAYGGPQSRNAHEIIAWLNERMVTSGATLSYDDLKDLPKEWNPIWHNHLLSHVYGMEYIVSSLERLMTMVKNDRNEVLEQQYQQAKVRLGQMEKAAITTAEAIVEEAWREFEKEMSLFNLGIDLLRNYPALGDAGVLVARPSFMLENPEDERYVDLRGLGSFNKGLVARVVSTQTNLGLTKSIERESQRGSFVGALTGETFVLPPINAIKKSPYVKREVYPSDYPEDVDMVVTKVAANNNNLGGVFTVFNPTNGDQWVGLLFNDSWKNPLIYRRVYFDDMTTALGEAIDEHVKAQGAVHQETKEQIGLGLVDNLPVITTDELLTGENLKKYITYDSLMAWWRLKMEDIKLKRKENGEVEYDKDLMDKMRVIINTGACGPAHPPKDQFISSFCDGGDKWVRMSNGEGGYYDKLSQEKSADCDYTAKPEYGKKLSEFCQGTTMMGRYSDGIGGSTTEVLKINSPDCGYVAPPPMGSVLAVFCVGVNQTARYADGKGGTYDMVSMVDTYICGGKIYPPGGNGSGPGPVVVDPKIILSSTHTKLTAGTTEILSFYATKFAPSTRYLYELLQVSEADGVNSVIFSGSFTTTDNGAFLWEQSRVDDGKTTPRGAYQNWVRVMSENVESNKISRNFIAGATPTEPDDKNNAGGGQAGGGKDAEGGGSTNVKGDPYGSDKTWPPLPVFDPKVTLSSDRPTLYLGTNEVMTIELTGFLAETDVPLSIWTKHPKITNGAAFQTLSVKVRTNRFGQATYRISNYDNGVVPRGTTTDWAEADSGARGKITSNTISRVFAEGTEGQAKWRALNIVTSHSQVYIGTTYTQSIVLTGATPNTNYVLELRRSQYTGTVEENNILIGSFSVTTDGAGAARYDYTDRYDGNMPAPKVYFFFARLAGLDQMSTISTVDFVAKPADQSGRGILTFSSSQQNIKPGMTEVLTATITNGTANKTVEIQHWNQSTSFNSGQPTMSHKSTMRIGSNGIGVSEVTVTDDNTTPRGTYQSWVTCSEESLISRQITRNFLTATGEAVTPSTNPMRLSYTTSTKTISPGVIETHTIEVFDGPKNGVVFVDMYIQSPALNNGNIPLKTTTRTVSTNSQGYGKDTFDSGDNGTAVPRGSYDCWVKSGDVVSPPITRTFIGTPPPTVQYNPKLVYTHSGTTIAPGQTDMSRIELTGFMPNTSYSVEFWLKGVNIFNGNDYNILTKTVTTDSQGRGAAETSGTYNGNAPPQGTYSNWGRVAETGTVSNYVSRTFTGTPPPTTPPYNPTVRYYSTPTTITKGTFETHTVGLAGMRPNTPYAVDIYIQSPALFNNTEYYSTTVHITTDSSGSGSTSFSQTEQGGTPKGTYANWAVEKTSGARSPVFTRVFV